MPEKATHLAQESRLKNHLKDLDSTKQTDYSLWKAVKNMQCPIAYESPIRLQNGQWAKSPYEKVEAFADHLENVFKPNNTSSTISPKATNYFITNPLKFRLSAVISAIKSFKSGNAILRSGYFPTSWKLSEIVMIPNPGKDVTQVYIY